MAQEWQFHTIMNPNAPNKSIFSRYLLALALIIYSGFATAQSWNTLVADPDYRADMIALTEDFEGNYIVLLGQFIERSTQDKIDTISPLILQYSKSGTLTGAFEKIPLDSLNPKINKISYKAKDIKSCGEWVLMVGYTEEHNLVRGFAALYYNGELSSFKLDSSYAYLSIASFEDNVAQIVAARAAYPHYAMVTMSLDLEVLSSTSFSGFTSVLLGDTLVTVGGNPILNRKAIYRSQTKLDTLATIEEYDIGGNIVSFDGSILFYEYGLLKTNALLEEEWRISYDSIKILQDVSDLVVQESKYLIQIESQNYLIAGTIYDPTSPEYTNNLFFMEVDTFGQIQWSTILPFNQAPLNSIAGILEVDGGYVILARDAALGNIWLVKLNEMGEFTTSIHDINGSPADVRIFPNPVTDLVTVSSSNSISKILLYDGLGTRVYDIELKNPTFTHQFTLSNQPPGIYYFSIQLSQPHNVDIIKKVFLLK